MAENRVTKFPGVLDADMNTELYLVFEEEITEEQFNAIKEGYGVTGPDFQIVEKNDSFFLKGDQDIKEVEKIVNALLVDKGAEAVFEEETEEEADADDNGGQA